MEALALAKKVAQFAFDKKAENIVVLDMRGVANFCDYFVICSATGARHVKAVADGVDEGLHELGIKVKFKQGIDSVGKSKAFFLNRAHDDEEPGEQKGPWVLLDMGDVVAHVFDVSSRSFYGLEHLWQGAIAVDWEK